MALMTVDKFSVCCITVSFVTSAQFKKVECETKWPELTTSKLVLQKLMNIVAFLKTAFFVQLLNKNNFYVHIICFSK